MTDWTCPACGRVFARRGQRHACGRHGVADVFPDTAGRAVVAAVAAVATGLGAVQEATRTQVGYRVRTRFAWLWRPPDGVGRLPEDAVVLSLDLPVRLDAPRVREAVEVRPGHWVHHVVLRGAGDVDAEVRDWLAWAASGAGAEAKR